MRAQRLSAMAVGALAVLGAAPFAAAQASAATTAASGEPGTELIIQGQPGDWITGGYTGVAQPPAQTVTASGTPVGGQETTGSVSFNATNLPAQQYMTAGWSLGGSLEAPTGTDLKVGVTYANAQRFADATHPGIEIMSTGRGCNQDTGSFTINQLTYSGTTLTALEAQFSQACDGGPAIQGVIRYNATGDLPPGAPTGRPPTSGAGTVEPMTFRRGGQIVSAGAGAVDGPTLGQVYGVSDVNVGQTAWSPLGTRLFFTSGPGLSSVRPDGSGRQAVSQNPKYVSNGNDEEPAVSPDGAFVAYVQGGGGGGWDNLMVANSDGGGRPFQVPLNGAPCQQEHRPSWGQDGTLIYECDPNGPGVVDTYHLSHGVSTKLIGNASGAVYSPDGSKIAFVRKDGNGVPQIFTVGADGTTGLTQVSQDANGASKPAWSPDGRYLAYVNTAFHEIVEIPAAGGSPVGSIPNADDPDWTQPVTDSQVVREAGADRIGTAVAASQLNFANHGAADRTRSQANAVVLARSDNFADALGGSALAVRQNAPLLITPSAGLNPAVKTEIGRVLAPGGTVYLLGGTQALSPAVASALSGYHVVRLAGDTRYGTAVAIAKAITPHPGTVMIATGALFPDALAAGATGEPVLLTDGASMPAETAAYLNTLNPNPAASGGTELVTVGGPGDAALISAYQGGKLSHWPSQISRLKLAGPDRYTTALMVAQDFFTSNTDAALATGASWPDALSGGAMIGHRGGPLLLTAPTGISPAVLSYLGGESASLYDLFLMGGPVALPNAIGQQAASVIGVPGHVRFSGVYGTAGKASAAGTDSGVGGGGTGIAGKDSASGRTAHGGELTPVSR